MGRHGKSSRQTPEILRFLHRPRSRPVETLDPKMPAYSDTEADLECMITEPMLKDLWKIWQVQVPDFRVGTMMEKKLRRTPKKGAA